MTPAPQTNNPTPREIAAHLRNVEGMGCNCDLDRWQPTATTGHSQVCRIHKHATARPHDMRPGLLDAVRASLEVTP
jgi:hypothetical protein